MTTSRTLRSARVPRAGGEPRRALVTGASGAIGAALCQRLAADGHALLIHANHRVDAAQALAQSLQAQGARAQAVAFDVTDGAAVTRALEGLTEEAPIDVLVNNAGIHDDAPLAGMSSTQWQRVIDVSLNGFFNVTRALLMPMIRQRWGRIVSMSSVAAIIGNRGQANYAAAKAALHAASKSLALEVASRGITVNVVAPGVIASPMAAQAFDQATIARLIPMQRAGQPQEVADLVAFLASDRAAYITGQVVSINGGMA